MCDNEMVWIYYAILLLLCLYCEIARKPIWISSFFIQKAGQHPATCNVFLERKLSPHLSNYQGGENQVAVNEKIRIKVKGYEHATVDAASAKIVEASKRNGARVSGPIPLPTDKEVVTILRATHMFKDSREQFELRTHKRLIDIIRPTDKTVSALQKLEVPAGVEIVMEMK